MPDPTQDATPREGDVAGFHVIAWFKCDKCGEMCKRLTVANVGPDRLIVERPPGEIVCNACTSREQDGIKAENKRHRARQSWAKRTKFPKMVLPPKGGASDA